MNRDVARPAVALLLLLCAGTAGTVASWRAQGQVTPSQLRAGTLDVTVDGALQGPGGATTVASLGLAGMVPGESVAADFPLANAGSMPLLYDGTGLASGALAPSLVYAVWTGGVAANSGVAGGGDRRGTCSGTVRFAPASLAGSARTVIPRRPLAVGASERVCVLVTLPATAPPSGQGQAASVAFTFRAVQQGAP